MSDGTEAPVVRKIADPTSQIVSQGDNEAHKDRLSPASSAETKLGYSPVEYDGEEGVKDMMTAEEMEAAKQEWLANPVFLGEPVQSSDSHQHTPTYLVAAGVSLFVAGLQIGALVQAAYSFLTA